MDGLLLQAGRAAGVVGILLVVISLAARLSGRFWFAGFQSGTLMLAGVAAISGGSFCLLWAVANRLKT